MNRPLQGKVEGGSRWDVVVVGAGPAGSMAARELARRGVRVLLADKAVFPRYKVCGCCLNGRALDILASVGMGGLMGDCGAAALECFELAAQGRKVCLPLPGGAALSRQVLDAALADAARAEGVRFVSGCRAVLREGNREGWTIELGSGLSTTKVQARAVLAADGLGQRLLRSSEPFESRSLTSAHIGAGAVVEETVSAYRPGVIHMAVAEAGYVGLVRVEGGRLNIAAALDTGWVRNQGGLAATVQVILEKAGYPVPAGLTEGQWRGTPPLTRRASRLSAHRFLVLGDAAGYVEPFTGEGMAWALSAGRAAAALLRDGLDSFDLETERLWEKRHAQLTRSAQWRCRAIAAALRSPLLVNAATRTLGRMPGLAAPIIGRLNVVPRVEKEMHL